MDYGVAIVNRQGNIVLLLEQQGADRINLSHMSIGRYVHLAVKGVAEVLVRVLKNDSRYIICRSREDFHTLHQICFDLQPIQEICIARSINETRKSHIIRTYE